REARWAVPHGQEYRPPNVPGSAGPCRASSRCSPLIKPCFRKSLIETSKVRVQFDELAVAHAHVNNQPPVAICVDLEHSGLQNGSTGDCGDRRYFCIVIEICQKAAAKIDDELLDRRIGLIHGVAAVAGAHADAVGE